MTRIARTSRVAALGAAALLALTACGGQSQDAEQTSAGQSASASENAGSSESGAAKKPEKVDFAAGDCLKNKLGARDVGTFEKVDCADEHNAEYLWAVPEKAEDDTTDTESACRAVGQQIAEGVETTVTATELTNSADQSKHCLVYALGEGWTGQQVDPKTTLEDAMAKADS